MKLPQNPGVPRLHRRHASAGVTLLELLVAMAVLSLIVVMGGQMINSSASVSGSAMTRLGIREEAREIFDRMELDFQNLAQTHVYEVSTQSNRVSLLACTGPDETERLKRIDYDLSEVNGKLRLLRSVNQVGWNDQQELDQTIAGVGEMLSHNVGAIGWTGLLSEGSADRALNLPDARGPRSLSALVVAMALADSKSIATTAAEPPQMMEVDAFPWFELPSGEEAKGWRLFSRTIIIP